ncbi:VOC family protein [Actinoplanes friuliensis]|uniref:Glyoxalase/bleomycin resistance protein/dioxygenase n=1 Tax=Actinoplanes friuliensis DSM 7358 TaxID=1246995 RepID=U5VXB1_9ACTN|nr:VOC family protein [Actinoplanes friuliensis]AGZ41514.1 glyoxalase/bleomycin resistance protein/dioxygenase [Actinoplanes friuliensis DSM 7358]
MTGQRTYPHGVTSWIDTEQPDPRAAAEFYGALFGWTLTAAGPTYLIATLDGKDVGGLAPGGDGQAVWNTYVAVDSADASAEAVTAAGGTVVSPPADPGPAGRAAVCRDPGGAEFRLWQARRRLGAQVTNVPGTWNFSDLHTGDPDAALKFYPAVFGWKAVAMPGAGTMLQVPGYGDHLASTVDPGIYERQAGAPPGFADVIGGLTTTEPGETPHWHVTFTVADRDGSAATAERLGATILGSADEMWAKKALVRDPQGAEFTVSQFAPPEDW